MRSPTHSCWVCFVCESPRGPQLLCSAARPTHAPSAPPPAPCTCRLWVRASVGSSWAPRESPSVWWGCENAPRLEHFRAPSQGKLLVWLCGSERRHTTLKVNEKCGVGAPTERVSKGRRIPAGLTAHQSLILEEVTASSNANTGTQTPGATKNHGNMTPQGQQSFPSK